MSANQANLDAGSGGAPSSAEEDDRDREEDGPRTNRGEPSVPNTGGDSSNDNSGESESSGGQSSDRDPEGEDSEDAASDTVSERLSARIATTGAIAAAGLNRARGFVEETKDAGTTADPTATNVEQSVRSRIGDPAAPVREFGSGLEARADDTREDVVDEFSDRTPDPRYDIDREEVETALDPRRDLEEDSGLREFLDEVEQADQEVTGGPVPGTSVVGPAAPIRATGRAIVGARSAARSGSTRSGPTGSQLAEGVGRQGEFVAEGAENLIRAGAVGGGIGATIEQSRSEIEQPTEVDEPAEIESPANDPTSADGELGAPVEDARTNDAEITAPIEEPGTSDAEIDAPTDAPGVTDPTALSTTSVAVIEKRPDVEEEREETTQIGGEDIADPFGEPDQAPPGVRERQRRDDLVDFERYIETGESAVADGTGQPPIEESGTNDIEIVGQVESAQTQFGAGSSAGASDPTSGSFDRENDTDAPLDEDVDRGAGIGTPETSPVSGTTPASASVTDATTSDLDAILDGIDTGAGGSIDSDIDSAVDAGTDSTAGGRSGQSNQTDIDTALDLDAGTSSGVGQPTQPVTTPEVATPVQTPVIDVPAFGTPTGTPTETRNPTRPGTPPSTPPRTPGVPELPDFDDDERRYLEDLDGGATDLDTIEFETVDLSDVEDDLDDIEVL